MPRSAAMYSGNGVSWPLNSTGAESVRGSIVEASDSVENGVELLGADALDGVGFVLESGIPDGDPMPVGSTGLLPALSENDVPAVLHAWVRSSETVAGRVTTNNAVPGPPTNTNHFFECGHCNQVHAGGTDIVVMVYGHFN